MAKHKILLSQAILGFLLDAEARSLSPHTIADYQNAFRKLQAFIGDPPIEKISADDIRRFLVDLSTRNRPTWNPTDSSLWGFVHCKDLRAVCDNGSFAVYLPVGTSKRAPGGISIACRLIRPTRWSCKATGRCCWKSITRCTPRRGDALARFAELEKSPEHIHTYRLSPLSLWNAAASGLTRTRSSRLTRYSKYDVPGNITADVRDYVSRFGRLKLRRDETTAGCC